MGRCVSRGESIRILQGSRNTVEIITYHDSANSKFRRAYLPQQQGTRRYNVVIAYLVEEKLHFSEVMKTLPVLNHSKSQSSRFKAGSQEWNREADGEKISHKVCRINLNCDAFKNQRLKQIY